MADITSPPVIAYSDEYLRPIAEALRDVQIMLADAKVEYTTNIAGLLTIYADEDTLAQPPGDSRSQLTKLDLTTYLTQLLGILTELETAGAEALRAKFTVHAPRF